MRATEKRRLVIAAAAVLGLLCAVDVSTVNVRACDCVRLAPLSAAVREETEFIFLGRVLEIVEREEHIRTTRDGGATGEVRPLDRQIVFAVQRAWRGVSSERVSVTSLVSDCMFAFEIGREYLVFARKGDDGRPTTGICTRTSGLTAAGPILAQLGEPNFKK
jgi:hypothetical protein